MKSKRSFFRNPLFAWAAVLATLALAFVGDVQGAAVVAICSTLLSVNASGMISPICRAYFDECLPTIASAPDSSGTSLTRYKTHALTPTEFVADGISENLRRVYGNITNAIMRGYQPNMLDMILFGRLRDYSMHLQQIKRGRQSIIQPFITMPKGDVVNTGAFVVTAGTASGAPNAYSWTLTIQNGPAHFQNATLPSIYTQFQPGDTIMVLFTNVDGSNLVRHLEIVSSVDSTVGSTPQATVVVQSPFTLAQWNALTSPQKVSYQPTGGLVMFGGNSTSNYRARANQKSLYNPYSLIQFWFQTQRKMFQWTDEYERANTAETMSEFAKAFELIPLADQIKMLDSDYMRSMANNLFWSQPYAGQNVDTWQTAGQIPVVYDLDGTTVMDVETRMKGIETQLGDCGQVLDFMGGAFSLDTVGPLLVQVARNRAGTGAARDQVWDVDVLVNTHTAALLKRVIATQYKDNFGIQYQQQVGRKTQEQFSQTNGIWANSYDLDDFNLTLNVISAFWLDDMFSMTPTAHKAASRYALFTDFTDIDWFVVEQKNRNVEYPPRNVPIDLTQSVISFNVKTLRFESITHGIAVKRPSRHLIVKGFSGACPIFTPAPCNYEG